MDLILKNCKKKCLLAGYLNPSCMDFFALCDFSCFVVSERWRAVYMWKIYISAQLCMYRTCCWRSSRRCCVCPSCPCTARASCWRGRPARAETPSSSRTNCTASKPVCWSCSASYRTNTHTSRWASRCVKQHFALLKNNVVTVEVSVKLSSELLCFWSTKQTGLAQKSAHRTLTAVLLCHTETTFCLISECFVQKSNSCSMLLLEIVRRLGKTVFSNMKHGSPLNSAQVLAVVAPAVFASLWLLVTNSKPPTLQIKFYI